MDCKKENPCKYCQKRSADCHAVCGDYLAWSKLLKESREFMKSIIYHCKSPQPDWKEKIR